MLEEQSLAVQDVIAAYRVFLGRNPENEAAVNHTLQICRSWAQLRQHFLNSQEFRERLYGGLPMYWPRVNAEVEVEATLLQKMFQHVQNTWEAIGKAEPYWSVLSDDQFKTSQMASLARQEEFYESGNEVVKTFHKVLERNFIDIGQYKSCIDFGCGVGRVTRWLAAGFERLSGVDVSSEHLAMARNQLQLHGITNVKLSKLNRVEEINKVDAADVIFSVIVLQHNPPPVIAYLIGQLLRKLNAGGIAYFQVPTYAVGYSFDAIGYLASRSPDKSIEMHVLPQADLFRIIENAGCRVLEIREDGWVGLPTWISNTVLVKKIP